MRKRARTTKKRVNCDNFPRWEYFVWHGQGQWAWVADPDLKVTEGLLKPCAKIKVDLPETLYENFFPTTLSSRRTPPPFQASIVG